MKALPSFACAGIHVLEGASVYSHSERSESCKIDGNLDHIQKNVVPVVPMVF